MMGVLSKRVSRSAAQPDPPAAARGLACIFAARRVTLLSAQCRCNRFDCQTTSERVRCRKVFSAQLAQLARFVDKSSCTI